MERPQDRTEDIRAYDTHKTQTRAYITQYSMREDSRGCEFSPFPLPPVENYLRDQKRRQGLATQVSSRGTEADTARSSTVCQSSEYQASKSCVHVLAVVRGAGPWRHGHNTRGRVNEIQVNAEVSPLLVLEMREDMLPWRSPCFCSATLPESRLCDRVHQPNGPRR